MTLTSVLRVALVLAALAGAMLWLLMVMAAHDLGSPATGASVGALRLVALPIVLLAVLLTAIFPSRRWLLHIGAVAMTAFAVGAALIARQSVIVATLALGFAAMWFLFYSLSLRRQASA